MLNADMYAEVIDRHVELAGDVSSPRSSIERLLHWLFASFRLTGGGSVWAQPPLVSRTRLRDDLVGNR
jgi:hypothetical protein